MGRYYGFLVNASLLASSLAAQTTQGLITGRVLDDFSGERLAGVRISAVALHAELETTALSDSAGRFTLPHLSPGNYRIRVSRDPEYQAQVAYRFDLHVASSLILEIRLRQLSHVFEKPGQRSMFLPGKVVLVFFGPDVDTSRSTAIEPPDGRSQALEATLSHLATRAEIDAIPLAGRDTYTFLAAVPGVTFDTGSARGLGYSVNGQRPSSSNFLLDGLEFNNYLVTGPLTAQQPEAMEEYRVSTSNFSPEFGRTAGYLANAVTRSGGREWHGLGYLYGTHQLLHAAEFQRALSDAGRRPYRELQPGFNAGGPVPKTSNYFFFTAYEHLRLRTENDPEAFTLPGSDFRPTGVIAKSLVSRFPLNMPRPPQSYRFQLAPRVSLDRTSWNTRLDAARGKWRWMTRLTLGRLNRPDLRWSPYEGLSRPLTQPATQLAGGGTWTVSPQIANEVRAGFTRDRLSHERPSPETPFLSNDGDRAILPSSPGEYSYRRRAEAFEIVDNLSLHRGRHAARFGAGFLRRRVTGATTPATVVNFDGLDMFALDQPFRVGVVTGPGGQRPDYERTDLLRQFHLYAQDAVRLTRRIAISGGIRYDDLGAPVFYAIAQQKWSGRAGVAVDLGVATVRAGYGLFFDGLFDNLWEDAHTKELRYRYTDEQIDASFGKDYAYLRPAGDLLLPRKFYSPTQLQEGLLSFAQLHTPSVRSGFAGVEVRPAPGWTADGSFLFSSGEDLPTTDRVQRNLPGRYRLRESRGVSSYRAVNARVRYASARAMFQASYVFARSRDVQSDPLQGELFNLTAFGRRGGTPGVWFATFPREGDPRGLFSWSDYDQRHGFLTFASVRLPQKWTASFLASARSGFPFSVLVETGSLLPNRTARQIAPSVPRLTSSGSQWLTKSDFARPAADEVFASARNAYRGPGLFSADLSVARVFALGKERWTATLRGDCYNFLNHANLGPPVTYYPAPNFGLSLRGRTARPASSPVLAPLDETGRRLQILLRLEF